jgi:hypothetical protein
MWKAPEGSLALVTYFRRKRTIIEGSNRKKVTVEFFKMIGDSIIESGEIDCPYIPIVPFKGSELFRNDKRIYVGIVDKAKQIQKTINYALSQLRERIAKAPKPLFWTTKGAIEGHEEELSNIDKNFNPVIVLNDPDKDSGGSLPSLNKIDNTFPTTDLGGVIDSNINYMSLIIGMPSTGLVGSIGENETAESVLMRSKSSESNQSHYYENAKASIKQVGRIISYFIAQTYKDEFIDFKPQDFEVKISEGPELITTKIEQRKDLLAFSQTLPENMKPIVSKMIAKTLDIEDSDILSQEITAMLPPELKPNLAEDPMAKQIMDQMTTQIDEMQSRLDQYTSIINQQQQQILVLEEDSQSQITIAQMNNLTKLKSVAMQEQGKDDRLTKEIIADGEKELIKMQTELTDIKLKNEMKRSEIVKSGLPVYSLQKGLNKI